jgi:hypothetical protein
MRRRRDRSRQRWRRSSIRRDFGDRHRLTAAAVVGGEFGHARLALLLGCPAPALRRLAGSVKDQAVQKDTVGTPPVSWPDAGGKW